MKFNVRVKDIPVRYETTTYLTGEEFTMTEEHLGGTENLLEVIGPVEVAPKLVDDMTIAELKEYAVEKEIDLGAVTKRDDIITAIKGYGGDE